MNLDREDARRKSLEVIHQGLDRVTGRRDPRQRVIRRQREGSEDERVRDVRHEATRLVGGSDLSLDQIDLSRRKLLKEGVEVGVVDDTEVTLTSRILCSNGCKRSRAAARKVPPVKGRLSTCATAVLKEPSPQDHRRHCPCQIRLREDGLALILISSCAIANEETYQEV